MPLKNNHKHEDNVAFFQSKNWDYIKKNGRFWEGEEYSSILEQGSFNVQGEEELVLAAAGRIKAALSRGQYNLDEMEENHKRMLCCILSIILYQKH